MVKSFWHGFDKRAEVLSEFSDSSSAGGTGDDINSEIRSHLPITNKVGRVDNGPLLGSRFDSSSGPRLDSITVESNRGPKGGMA